MYQSILIMTLMTSLMSSPKSALNNYEITKTIYTDKELNNHYVGKIFATGGAMSDINRYIKEMEPTYIGSFKSNTLILIESDTTKNQEYHFKKVKCYQVKTDRDTFNILYMKSTLNGEKYEIIVEVRPGPSYDYTLWVHKNGKPKIMILWVDKINLSPKKDMTL